MTKINIKPTEKAKSFMRMQGVPTGLLREFNIDLDNSLAPVDINDDGKEVIISEEKQLEVFNRLCKQPKYNPFVLVINSQHFFLQARQITTILFWSYMQNCLNKSDEFNGELPTWVVATNEYKNHLLEKQEKGQMHFPLPIVIDSIYSDAPMNKLDKVHDWVSVFCDRPIILVMHTEDPFGFCINKLGCRPNMIMNLARPVSKKINVI